MDSTELPRTRCHACGEVIDVSEGDRIRIMDLPYALAEQIEDKYPKVAEQILRNDGKLAVHSDCEHPVESLLDYSDEYISDFESMDYEDYSTECPVCNIRVANSNDLCGRCGAEIKSNLPNTEVREVSDGIGSSLYGVFTKLPTYFL